jgi:hypothetical protein
VEIVKSGVIERLRHLLEDSVFGRMQAAMNGRMFSEIHPSPPEREVCFFLLDRHSGKPRPARDLLLLFGVVVPIVQENLFVILGRGSVVDHHPGIAIGQHTFS